MILAKQFREHVIIPTLAYMDQAGYAVKIDTDDAVQLLLGTALAESGLAAIRQIGGGPGASFFQLEPATIRDNNLNFLAYHPRLQQLVERFMSHAPGREDQIFGNQYYACAHARIKYLRDRKALPSSIEEQAEYWKRIYNTELGAGTVEHYVEAWKAAMG